MPKPCSLELRERVVDAVESGASRREAAEWFDVSASSAIKWMQRRRATGSIAPKPSGGSISPRTAATMKQLYESDQVFGLVGNVGTPTAVVALPYALDRKMLFFGAFTGAGLLRNDPPDRYVFNYRASYAEETAAVVNYLVKVRRLLPEQIAVFAQQDAYGDAGFAGVEKAIRSLQGGNESPILRLNYQRNTVDVDDAVAQLQQRNAQLQQKRHAPIRPAECSSGRA